PGGPRFRSGVAAAAGEHGALLWGGLGQPRHRRVVGQTTGGDEQHLAVSIDPLTLFWIEMNRRAANNRGFLSGQDRKPPRSLTRLRKRRG
ncbi:MAG TPA: hypothetical protein VIC62_00520, partial [Nakamurella sp.]